VDALTRPSAAIEFAGGRPATRSRRLEPIFEKAVEFDQEYGSGPGGWKG
jgi:hypothetical protein